MSTTNKMGYGSEVAATITLASLGSSSTFVDGQESNSVDNSSTLALDYLISGQITVGTSPTTGTQILVYAFSTIGTSLTFPDVFDGTNSAETLTSAGIGQGFLKRVATLNVDSGNSNRAYPFGKVSLAQLFGNVCPKTFGFFVTHNTVAALHATGGNHFIIYEPISTTNG